MRERTYPAPKLRRLLPQQREGDPTHVAVQGYVGHGKSIPWEAGVREATRFSSRRRAVAVGNSDVLCFVLGAQLPALCPEPLALRRHEKLKKRSQLND